MKIESIRFEPLNYNEIDEEEYLRLKRDVQNRRKKGKKWFVDPIIVRPLDSGLCHLVDGHKRISISEELGISEIPDEYIEVENLTEEEADEDFHSRQLKGRRKNPILQASWLQDKKDKYKLTQKELAEKFNLSESRISNILRRLKHLHPEIIQELSTSKLYIPERTINELMKFSKYPETQLALHEECKKGNIDKDFLKDLNASDESTFSRDYRWQLIARLYADYHVPLEQIAKVIDEPLKVTKTIVTVGSRPYSHIPERKVRKMVEEEKEKEKERRKQIEKEQKAQTKLDEAEEINEKHKREELLEKRISKLSDPNRYHAKHIKRTNYWKNLNLDQKERVLGFLETEEYKHVEDLSDQIMSGNRPDLKIRSMVAQDKEFVKVGIPTTLYEFFNDEDKLIFCLIRAVERS